MSLLRFSHPNRSPIFIDQGPGYARVSGYGGRLVTPIAIKRVPGEHVNIPTVNEVRRAAKRTAERQAIRQRELVGDPRPNTPRCGFTLRVLKEPCTRFDGHKGEHRSRMSMDNAAVRRRAGFEL